jgi:hypothetical protein
MKLITIALGLSLGLAGIAQAHAPAVGANGGRQVNAGPYHMEMIVEGQGLTIFLRDHGDRPVQTTGFRGTAVLTLDGRAERVALIPAGANQLTGTGTRSLPERPRAIVQVTNAAGSSAQGRFD